MMFALRGRLAQHLARRLEVVRHDAIVAHLAAVELRESPQSEAIRVCRCAPAAAARRHHQLIAGKKHPAHRAEHRQRADADYGIVPDNLEATRQMLRKAAAECDIIVTSGGVSVGDADFVKPAVEAEGELLMWKIAMKPGRPLAFGRIQKSSFIGLPGNPVSSFVTFLIFVKAVPAEDPGSYIGRSKSHCGARGLRLARARRPARVPARKMERAGRPRPLSDAGLGGADLDGVGRRLVDNPAGGAIRRGDPVRFLAYSELYR